MIHLRLTEYEANVVKHALEDYLSNLREEIVKTEKHEWKKGLHTEEDALKSILEKLMTMPSAS